MEYNRDRFPIRVQFSNQCRSGLSDRHKTNKAMESNKRICDRCNNFHVSQCGSTEVCYANLRGSQVIPLLTEFYIELRITGEKNNCKEFEKLTNAVIGNK